MDAEDDGFATGLTNSIAKDGQTTPTANLPMGGFKHTNIADGTAANQYASVGQLQDNLAGWADAGGTADAITATFTPTVTALTDGMLLGVRAGTANATTTPTFQADATTARTIVKAGGAALIAGDIVGDDHELLLRYDLANTRWELLNPGLVTGAATVAAARSALGLVIGTDVNAQMDTVSQADAEAGTATDRRAWTAQRVGQAIAALVPLPRSYLTGLTLSHGGSTSITVGAGSARDDGDAADMVLASVTAKTSSAWAVGSTNGGLDTGTVANDTWYHVWLIKRSDTGVVDALFSTSATSPTMPANYDLKRRVGAVLTGGSANFLSFVQRGDVFLWNNPPLDISLSATITTSQTLAAISVPTGFNIQATIIAGFEDASADAYVYISSPTIGDEAATSGRAQLSEEGRSLFNRAQLDVVTDTSARIRIRSNVATIDTFNAYTVGWVDRRGKDD